MIIKHPYFLAVFDDEKDRNNFFDRYITRTPKEKKTSAQSMYCLSDFPFFLLTVQNREFIYALKEGKGGNYSDEEIMHPFLQYQDKKLALYEKGKKLEHDTVYLKWSNKPKTYKNVQKLVCSDARLKYYYIDNNNKTVSYTLLWEDLQRLGYSDHHKPKNSENKPLLLEELKKFQYVIYKKKPDLTPRHLLLHPKNPDPLLLQQLNPFNINKAYKELKKVIESVQISSKKQDLLEEAFAQWTPKEGEKEKNPLNEAEKQALKKALQSIAKTALFRRKTGFFHPTNTTCSGNTLLATLNKPKYNLIRMLIRPSGEKIHMRDLRHFAREGTAKKPPQSFFLTQKEKEDERHFSFQNQSNPFHETPNPIHSKKSYS